MGERRSVFPIFFLDVSERFSIRFLFHNVVKPHVKPCKTIPQVYRWEKHGFHGFIYRLHASRTSRCPHKVWASPVAKDQAKYRDTTGIWWITMGILWWYDISLGFYWDSFGDIVGNWDIPREWWFLATVYRENWDRMGTEATERVALWTRYRFGAGTVAIIWGFGGLEPKPVFQVRLFSLSTTVRVRIRYTKKGWFMSKNDEYIFSLLKLKLTRCQKMEQIEAAWTLIILPIELQF